MSFPRRRESILYQHFMRMDSRLRGNDRIGRISKLHACDHWKVVCISFINLLSKYVTFTWNDIQWGKLLILISSMLFSSSLYAMGDTSGNRSPLEPYRLKPWGVSLCQNTTVTQQSKDLAMRYDSIRYDLINWIDQQAHAVRQGYIQQLAVPVRGLWASYEDTSSKWSKYLAYYGRVFVYDTSLALYTSIMIDSYRNNFSRSRQAVDVILKLFEREEAKSQIGLLHFSYNTNEDSFIDPRAITGANVWMFKSLYAYMLTSGDYSIYKEVTRYARQYLLPLQVLDSESSLYGFITAGYAHPMGMEQGGYQIYADLNALNTTSDMAVLEHNADFIELLRLMEFASQKCQDDSSDAFHDELVNRHALVMQAAARVRKSPHWPTLINAGGEVNWSMAVDHYTWMASTFIGLDNDVAWQSIGVLQDVFTTNIDSMEILIGPIPKRLMFSRDATGLIFFERSFTDPYVTLSEKDRLKLENLIQPEATAGGIVFLYRFAQSTTDHEQVDITLTYMEQLLDGLSAIHEVYRSVSKAGGMPYATENTHQYFNSTPSMAATASYYMALEILLTGYPYFLAVPAPDTFSDALTRTIDIDAIPRPIKFFRR